MLDEARNDPWRVAELPKDAGNLQYTEQTILTLNNDRTSCIIDDPTFAKAGPINHQNVEDEFCLQTGDETMVISG